MIAFFLWVAGLSAFIATALAMHDYIDEDNETLAAWAAMILYALAAICFTIAGWLE